ncbi:MAG: DUF1629 domain-containing protein [Dokdonella sp.]
MSGIIIFKPSGQESAELCHPVGDDTGFELAGLIDGSPRLANWEPVEFKLWRREGRRKLLAVDAPWYATSILLFKPTVIRAIADYLQRYGELLPLICKDAEIVMYNPTRVIDALDEQASEIERFDNGRIMTIDKHVFHADRIRNVDIFKLPMRASSTYVSQRFIDIWTAHKLTGLNFVPVK